MSAWTTVPLLLGAAILFFEVPARVKAIMLIILAVMVLLLRAAALEEHSDQQILSEAREKAYDAGYCRALLTEGLPNSKLSSWCRVEYPVGSPSKHQ